jgi:hypothetical protein
VVATGRLRTFGVSVALGVVLLSGCTGQVSPTPGASGSVSSSVIDAAGMQGLAVSSRRCPAPWAKILNPNLSPQSPAPYVPITGAVHWYQICSLDWTHGRPAPIPVTPASGSLFTQLSTALKWPTGSATATPQGVCPSGPVAIPYALVATSDGVWLVYPPPTACGNAIGDLAQPINALARSCVIAVAGSSYCQPSATPTASATSKPQD